MEKRASAMQAQEDLARRRMQAMVQLAVQRTSEALRERVKPWKGGMKGVGKAGGLLASLRRLLGR